MITTKAGYSIIQIPKENKIVISIPALPDTINSTIGIISANRKRELDENELAIIVGIVEHLFENGE